MTIPLIKSNLGDYERLFLSLGDKTRLKLLTLMADEPVSVGYLVDELGESQPKVSRHLAYLRNSGIVSTKRDGKWIYYAIQQSGDPDIDKVIEFVIRTLSGATPTQTVTIKKPQLSKSEASESASTKVEAGSVLIQAEPEPWIEPDMEIVDFDYQEEEEEEEEDVFIESAPDANEMEVFLL